MGQKLNQFALFFQFSLALRFGEPRIPAGNVFEAAFDEIDGEVSDINADPLATEFLRHANSRAATAEQAL